MNRLKTTLATAVIAATTWSALSTMPAYCAPGAVVAEAPLLNPTKVAALMRSKKLFGFESQIQVILTDKGIVISTVVEPSMKDEALRKLCLDAAAAVLAQKPNDIETVTVIAYLTDHSNNYRSVTVNLGSLLELPAPPPVIQSEMAVSGPTNIKIIGGIASVINEPAGVREFISEHSRNVERIYELDLKRVGVSPFRAEMAKVDNEYNGDNLSRAKEFLLELSDHLDKAEKSYTEARKVQRPIARVDTSLPLPPGLGPSKTATAMESAQGPASSAAEPVELKYVLLNDPKVKRLLHDITTFKGKSKDFDQMFFDRMGSLGFGVKAPVQGPFFHERWVILARIGELAKSGVNVNGYRDLYNSVEAGLLSKDMHAIGDAKDKLQYLQTQLGLEGLKHEPRKAAQ